MTYVIGAAAGILFGALVGILKNIILWKKYVNKKPDEHDPDNASAVYGRMMVSNIINVATLVICFLVRDVVPFNWIAMICGAAVSLSVINIVLSARLKN